MGHEYWYCKAITGSFYGPANGMLNFLNSCLGIETKMGLGTDYSALNTPSAELGLTDLHH